MVLRRRKDSITSWSIFANFLKQANLFLYLK